MCERTSEAFCSQIGIAVHTTAMVKIHLSQTAFKHTFGSMDNWRVCVNKWDSRDKGWSMQRLLIKDSCSTDLLLLYCPKMPAAKTPP